MSVLSCSRSPKPWSSLPTLALAIAGLCAPHAARAQAAVLTQNNDNARTGANTAEPTLSPTNVRTGSFGKLFTITGLDANVNGQVLYAPALTIKGATHNALLFYTSNNSTGSACGVYAYDADSGTQLWFTALPASAQYTTASPVIDPATGTMYVLTKSTNDTGPTYLRAFDVTSGAQKASVQVQASAAGTGAGSVNNVVHFDGPASNGGTFRVNDRAALLLLNGVVYLSVAYNTDNPPYHGWVLGYDAASLTQKYVFCTTPNGSDGGVWMAGKGLAADAAGNVYCSVGNGTFDANTGGADYGMCYLKLSPSLKVLDYFSPYDESAQSNSDLDIANSGPVGIPGTTRLFSGATKFGSGFLYNSANLGQFIGPNKPAAAGVDGVGGVVQRLDGLSGNDNVGQNPVAFDTGGVKYVYLWPDGKGLEQFQYDPTAGTADKNGQKGQLSPAGIFKQSAGLTSGGSLAVSASSNNNAILWAVGPHDNSKATLYALNAADVSQAPLYSDASLSAGHFQFPTVANGKVYVPTGSASVAVYGLLTPTAPLLPLYRSYASASGDHFYTTNGAEADAAIEGSYRQEGVIGYAPTTPTGTAPIYRLYYPPTGDHFYTNSQSEAQTVATYGYTLEGAGYSVFTAAGTRTLPLYRLYSPAFGHHFYTTNQAEHDALVASGSWTGEGVLGYLSAAP